MMRTSSRVWLAAAALLLGLAFVRPLWHIALEAPQYPEGLGIYIWVDTITGQEPHDLENINGLNHYIGMKTIVPNAIPELRVMPPVLWGLVALGVLGALIGWRSWLYTWTAALTVLAFTGLVDFWMWGYDYGHDLDASAAIQVPDLSYQPPLIGTKQLLNFTATSWPDIGGWAIALALAIGLRLCVGEWQRTRQGDALTRAA